MSPTSARRRSPVDVFRYLDYRKYLEDFYRAKKKQRGFSFRAFSRSAGLGAPNYLQLVIAGRRNLTAAMAARFAAACGLAGEAAEYFVHLVEFNQARSAERRAAAYQRLTGFDRYRRAHRLEVAQDEYHSKWFLPAIRELVISPAFREDPEWIAAQLWPAIKALDAKHALETLVGLGLLRRDPHGRLRQENAVVSTGAQTRGMHIVNYHAEMMRRATASMELVPATSRDISSLTFCLPPSAIPQLKQRIAEFRRELIAMAESQTDRTQVVQLNFQLFPLSKPAAEDGGQARETKENRDG